MLAGVVTVICVTLALVAMPADLRTRMKAMIHTPPERAAMLALLSDLKVAWDPAQRARVIERARDYGDNLALAYHWVLAQPSHRYIEQAIDLAGELKVQAARDDLMQLGRHRSLRARAVLAADNIVPLSEKELLELFDETDKQLLLAAVEIASRRDAPPIAPLLQLLQHGQPELRSAALHALPREVPAEFAPELRGIANDLDAEIAAYGLHALSHTPFDEVTEELLADATLRPEARVVAAAVEALGQKAQPLAAATSQQLWSLIDDPGRERLAVAGAFLAMERTRSIDVDYVRQRLPGLDPICRYFAARLLLRAGASDGVARLFELLQDCTDENSKPLRFAILTLLGGIARMHASSSEDELRSWFAVHPVTGPLALPEPQLDL